MYAQEHFDWPWKFEAISVAWFFMFVGAEFVEAAREDSQSTPRQLLSQKLLLSAAMTSIGLTALLEMDGMVGSHAIASWIGFWLSAAIMFSTLMRCYSRRNVFVIVSTWIIGLGAVAILHFGLIDDVSDRGLIASIMAVIVLLVLLFLMDWDAPSIFGRLQDFGSNSENAAAVH